MDQRESTGRIGSADIAGLLRREIAQGQLAPRDKLPAERALAESYGVARGTVRDALTQLADEGLVQVRPGSGTYISDALAAAVDLTSAVFTNAQPLELIDARLALEPHICWLAAINATQKDLDEAEEQITIMQGSVTDRDKFVTADQAFRTALVQATGNRLLVKIASQTILATSHSQCLRLHKILDDATTSQSSHHRQILDAISARESARAESIMKIYLQAARRSLTQADAM